MKNYNSKIKATWTFCIVILIFTFLFLIWWLRHGTGAGNSLDSFAQCLASKGAVMYGTYWCPHCQDEKKAFGDSFRFVPYVECTAEPQKCLDAGIKGYPTWTFPDGRKLEGKQGIEKLSQESGCPLP